MATRGIFMPENAKFPASNFAAYTQINERGALAFDASTAESCYFPYIAPQGLTGTQTFIIHYFMASATSGKVDFTVAVEAITPGDATDLDTTTSFDTANTITAPTVPGTAGYPDAVTCTLTNVDSMAAGDTIRFKLTRDATDATNDTATGDCYVYACEWRDGA